MKLTQDEIEQIIVDLLLMAAMGIPFLIILCEHYGPK